jgi:hypothetical protein
VGRLNLWALNPSKERGQGGRGRKMAFEACRNSFKVSDVKLRLETLRWRILLMAGLAAGSAMGIGWGQSTPEPATRSVTNRVAEPGGLEALMRIEGELNRVLGGGSRKSLEGLMAPPRPNTPLPPPPRQTPAPSRRSLEELEKRRNWMFLEPEDMEEKPGQGMEREETGPLGEDLKLTPWERYYLRLGGSIPGIEKRPKSQDTALEKKPGKGVEEGDFGGSLGTTAKELRTLLEKESFPGFQGRPSEREENLFGFGQPGEQFAVKVSTQHLFQRGGAVARAVQRTMRSVRMPWPMAILPISRVLARAMISLRISSVTVMASMMASGRRNRSFCSDRSRARDTASCRRRCWVDVQVLEHFGRGR